jgi:prophage tail gpP-like protein
MAAPPDQDEQRLVVEFEQSGRAEDKILSYRINSSYTTPTDGWELTVYSEDDPIGLRRRWRPWQPVRLLIAGRQQLIGRIDRTESTGASSLKVSGRDYLADIVDGTVDPSFQIKKGQDLGDFLLELFAPYGVKTILADGNDQKLNRNVVTGRIPFRGAPRRNFRSLKTEDHKAQENEGVWEFGSRVVAHHGFCIQPAATRDAVLVTEPNYLQGALYKASRPGNIVSEPAAIRDYTDVPTVTMARGRAGEAGGKIGSAKGEIPTFDQERSPSRISNSLDVQRIITSDDGVVVVRERRYDPKDRRIVAYGYDPAIYKPLFFRDKDAQNQEQIDHAVRRMLAEKLRETLTYPFTVRGHVEPASGAVWSVDTIVWVDDHIEDVAEALWIHERTLYNDGSGPMTQVKAIRQESYVY